MGKPDKALLVRQVWAGSGLFSRSPRNSFTWHSVRFSVTVLPMLFCRWIVAQSFGSDPELAWLPILHFPTCVLAAEIRVRLRRRIRSQREIGPKGRRLWNCQQRLQSLANPHSFGDWWVWHLAAYGYGDSPIQSHLQRSIGLWLSRRCSP